MARELHAVVLGLGGIGSGTAYWLARRLGGEVLGLEQFALGHPHGGSHDHSRIIRYSYHTPGYVALAERAYRTWAVVEQEAGEPLVHRVGGLDLFPPGGTIPADSYTGSLTARGISFELLDVAAVCARWPEFSLPAGTTALYQRDGGLVAAARATAAHQRLARARGAVLREGVAVERVEERASCIEVTAGGEVWRAQRLVVAAGAWSARVLASFGLELPLVVTQEQVTYFQPRSLRPFAPERFPVWIWMDDPCYYGFPVFGEPAVKVARDAGGREVTVATRDYEPDLAALRDTEEFLARHLPAALGPPLLTKTCLYTLTPDRDFVIDRVPGTRRVFVAIGAGHAFKFASAIGQVLAELALDGETGADLAPFRIDRPILGETDPPRSWMV